MQVREHRAHRRTENGCNLSFCPIFRQPTFSQKLTKTLFETTSRVVKIPLANVRHHFEDSCYASISWFVLHVATTSSVSTRKSQHTLLSLAACLLFISKTFTSYKICWGWAPKTNKCAESGGRKINTSKIDSMFLEGLLFPIVFLCFWVLCFCCLAALKIGFGYGSCYFGYCLLLGDLLPQKWLPLMTIIGLAIIASKWWLHWLTKLSLFVARLSL